MREDEGTFKSQAAEANGSNCDNSKSLQSETLCYTGVKKSRTDSCTGFISSTKTNGKKYSLRHIPGNKSREVEKIQDNTKGTPRIRSSRGSSLSSNNSSNLVGLSTVNDPTCYKEQAVSDFEKQLLVVLNKIPREVKFDDLESFGLQTKKEYLKCKQAVVCLEDCLKTEKCTKNGISTKLSEQRYSVKMKQVGARSPKRQSPVRNSATVSGTKDSPFIRTTYTKPSKDTVIDGKSSLDSKAQTSARQDDLVPDMSVKVKKKGNIAMKKEAVRHEEDKVTKKHSNISHGDSLISETENAETENAKPKSKTIDTGQGDTACAKDTAEKEKTNSPKKRGRKPKSAESMPFKGERKISESNPGGDTNATPDIVITPSKDDRKTSKSPRSRKKKGESENSPDTLKEISSDNDKLAVGKNSRLSSESPSPVRRKRSPKLHLDEKESPKAKKKGNEKKSKIDKVEIECDVKSDIEETNQVIDINDSHVDEVIDDVVNRNIEMLNKQSSKKSPLKKNKQSESPEKKMASTNKDKKSPRKKSQDKETCSDEKKKSRSRSNSASPKKEKKKPESMSGPSDDSPSPVKKLDFDDQITKVIIEKSKLPFPSDFQYKYPSSTIGCLGLNDLISKVDSLVKNKDDNLTALLGKVETEYYSEETSPSSNDTDVNTSTDSDKTIIEFEDVQENSFKDSEISGENDSAEHLDSSFDDDKNDTSEKLEDVKSDKSKSGDSGIDLIDKMEKSDVKSVCDKEIEKVSKNCDTELDSGKKINKVSDNKNSIDVDVKDNVETVSVFEMFGLTLKKTKINENDSKEEKVGDNVTSDIKKDNSESEQRGNEIMCKKVGDQDDGDVMFVSETKPEDSIVILSDDEEEDKGVDRSGFETLKETFDEKKTKPKLTTINNVVEPKPLDILYKLERADSRKESAFTCNELDEYLDINKENLGSVQNTVHNATERNGKSGKKMNIKEELKKAEPDIDEVDGHVFVCFATESVLNAHVSLEKKLDWVTETQLRKMAHLKHMKERQHDLGSRRLTDVKCGDEQKQNFRGIPMRLMKYQKLLKQELEDMLLGRQPRSPEKSPSKTPTKTTDIRKIKGWKKKFHNPEEIQEATGLNISESGKVHWKTEERLVKNLDPEEIKDIGLDLKKKRRKLVNYSNKRKSGNEDKEAEMMEYEYEIDDLAIIESDVYNEDEDKPPPEKIPYNVKYSSQHKYGARKLFVKKMKLDAEDERILQKLGTQKHLGQKQEMVNSVKRKKGKQMFSLCKLTHTMALAAVSAFDKNLLKRAKGMDKTDPRKTKRESRSARKEVKAAAQSESPEIKEEVDPDYYFDNEDDYENNEVENETEEHVDDKEEDTKEEQGGGDDENESDIPECKPLTKRRHSSACRGRNSRRNSASKSEDNFPEELKVEIKKETVDTCNEPGCRYGCICHLCKLSDSGEEKEMDFKPPCEKEYCRLGCICESIDTNSAETEHCRKPGCMFKCKCPPKQPKPDIPREREHSKKKKGRGGKKKKRSPEKPESEQSGKEEDIMPGDDDWEPPNKRKRGPTNSRFANLPKRETTYRLAKNLDAVSRKAMEVYASSEMFTEQKMRKRKSDPAYDDSYFMSQDPQERRRSVKQDSKLEPRLNEETGILEISDDESDGEVFPEGLVSCSRIQPYSGPYKQKRDLSQLNKRKGGTGIKKLSNTVIDLVDSDKEDNSNDNKNKNDLPSTSSGMPPQSLTEKMGLTNRLLKKTTGQEKNNLQDKAAEAKWKTQMVCLKAKKKSDDKSQDPQSEIKLLEIMSNCNWEIDRTNMLSKISHIISKEYMCDAAKSTFIPWGAYLLEFLPKAEKPAIIPPELKSKLPSEMFSIRIKVTNNINKDDKVQKADDSVAVVDVDQEDSKGKEASAEDKKKINMKLQKKLIDKIKFAERLRNQLILEEQRGVTTSKFSVSREGIEKALKKYKTQLWKAYTGSSNFTLQQLKQALHAAKVAGANKFVTSDTPAAEAVNTKTQSLSSTTLERIQSNQGVTIVTASGPTPSHHSFINLANFQQEDSSPSSAPVKSVGNIVIHGHTPKSNQVKPNQGKGFMDNIENVKKFECTSAPSVSQVPAGSLSASKIHPVTNVSQSGSSKLSPTDVVLMPLDKNMHLPPGAKVTFMQPVLNRDGSPVPFSATQQTMGGTPIRTVVLPNTSQMSGYSVVKPLLNSATSLPSTQPANTLNIQSPNMSGIHQGTVVPNLLMPVPSTSGVFMNGTAPVLRPAFQLPQYVGSVSLPSSSVLPGLPLKNISNLGTVVSSDNAGVTFPILNGATVSSGTSSICPGNFNHGIPRSDMIGMPKVASMPFTVVPDTRGKHMLLVPVTSTVMPCSTGPNTSGNDVVNPQVGKLPGAGPPLSRQNSTSPLIFAVPVSDSGIPLNNKEHVASTVTSKMKSKGTTDKPQNSEENGVCKPASNISETVISKVDKVELEKVEEVLDKSNSGNNKCVNVENETDIGDKNNSISCTKSLSSHSNVIKTDTDALDDKSNESLTENASMKHQTTENNAIEGSELTDALNVAKNAAIENALKLINKSDTERGVNIDLFTQSKEKNQMVKKDSKSNSECVVLDDSDEECVLLDEHNESKVSAKLKASELMKSEKSNNESSVETDRKTPEIESIDWEQEIQIMEDYMENEQNDRNRSKSREKGANKIDESEESDVDVTSCDMLDPCPEIYISEDPSFSTAVPTGSKRKSQLTIMPHDDFQIKKCRMSEEYEGPAIDSFVGKTCKIRKEQYRRIELRDLFSYLEKVVFKYNNSLQRYYGRIPRHAILQEGINLISALGQREELLRECIEDGQQYEKTLEAKLKQQIDSFVESGVPEAILRNFLKSVEKSVLIHTKTKKKNEPVEVLDLEENDSVLEYKQLRPGNFQEIPLPESKLVRVADYNPGKDKIVKSEAGNITTVQIVKSNGDKKEVLSYINLLENQIEHQYDESSFRVSIPSAAHNPDTCEDQESENDKVKGNTVSDGVSSKLHNDDDDGNQQESSHAKSGGSLITTNISSNTTITTIQSNAETSNVIKTPHEQQGCAQPICIEDTPTKNVQSGSRIVSCTVTPGQKSSSDEDEVRSSTGDALMDHEGDFMSSDQWGDASKLENPKQLDSVSL